MSALRHDCDVTVAADRTGAICAAGAAIVDGLPIEQFADAVIHHIRHRLIQRDRLRVVVGWRTLAAAGRVPDDANCSSHEIAAGSVLLVCCAPFQEGDLCSYVVDLHRNVYKVPWNYDLVDDFLEQYPTRAARAQFAILPGGGR